MDIEGTDPAAAGLTPETPKRTRKRATKVKREPRPRKPAAKMAVFIGNWRGSYEGKDLRFEVVAVVSSPDGVRSVAVNLPPDNYDTITGRKGSVTVEEKTRKAVTVG